MSDGEIVLWVFAALVGAAALLFLLQILMVGITFSLLYGRVEHTHSRRALFSDLPAIGVRRGVVPVGRREVAVYHLRRGEREGAGLLPPPLPAPGWPGGSCPPPPGSPSPWPALPSCPSSSPGSPPTRP